MVRASSTRSFADMVAENGASTPRSGNDVPALASDSPDRVVYDSSMAVAVCSSQVKQTPSPFRSARTVHGRRTRRTCGRAFERLPSEKSHHPCLVELQQNQSERDEYAIKERGMRVCIISVFVDYHRQGAKNLNSLQPQ